MVTKKGTKPKWRKRVNPKYVRRKPKSKDVVAYIVHWRDPVPGLVASGFRSRGIVGYYRTMEAAEKAAKVSRGITEIEKTTESAITKTFEDRKQMLKGFASVDTKWKYSG